MQSQAADNQAHVRSMWSRLVAAAEGNDWLEADRLFNETRQYAKANDMAYVDLHVHYAAWLTARGEFERSLPHLRFLRDLYAQLGVTDFSFLGLRGVPPFETYLELARMFLAARPENMAHLDLLEALTGTVDPEGRAAAQAAIAALRTQGPAG